MSVDLAHHKIFRAKVGKDGIKCNRELRQIEKYILPCNYQLSKSIVVIQLSCKGFLILIGSLRCLKEEIQWAWYSFSAYFKIGVLNFSNICCRYTLELPHRGNYNVHLQHIEAITMCTYNICPFNK